MHEQHLRQLWVIDPGLQNVDQDEDIEPNFKSLLVLLLSEQELFA